MLKTITDMLIGPALTRPPGEGGGIAAHRATRGDSTKGPLSYVTPVIGIMALGYGAFLLAKRARR